MYSVTKQFHFCAAHRLHDYEGKCKNVHGHNYKVEITLESVELKDDMVLDFGKMSESIGKWINDTMDHVLFVSNQDSILLLMKENMMKSFKCFYMDGRTTAENIACLIRKKTQEMVHREDMFVRVVSVWETDNCCATSE